MADRDLTIRLKLDRSQATRENQRFGDEAKKVEQEVAAAAEKAESQKAAASSKSSRSKLSDAESTSSRIKRSLSEEENSHGKTGEAAKVSYGKMAIAGAVAKEGVSRLIALVEGLGNAFTAAGEKSKQLTANFASQRDDLGELAALMGKTADNNFTLDFARFNTKTGFKSEEGRQFLTELYNSGAQYQGKHLSAEEFAQFGEQTGNLAVARQIKPEVVGDVAGSMLGFTNFQAQYGDLASEHALGKTNSALAILGRGKGDNSVLARQFSMLSSSSLNEEELKGTFSDSDEVAAAISIAAEKHDAQAAELTKIAGRGLRGYDKKQGDLLRRAGVKPSDSFIQSFEKLNAVVTDEVSKRQQRTPGFKVEDYLRENLEDEGQIDAFNVFLNKGVAGGGFRDRLEFGRENAGPKKALDLIGESQSSERWLARQAEAQVQLTEAERGSRNSQVDILRKQVLAELIRAGDIDTNASGIKDFLVGKTSFGLLGSGEQVRIDEAAQLKLIKRNGGVDDQSFGDYLNFSPTAREGDLRSRIQRIQAAGGDALHDSSGAYAAPQKSAEMIDVLKRIEANTSSKKTDEGATVPSAPGVKLPGAPRARTER